MNKLDMQSIDIVDENIERIYELFPNVIVESANGKTIDFDLLKQELSKEIVEGAKEKYQLTWPGKKEAIVNANTPSKNTLRPIREKSVDFDNTENIYIEGDNLEALKILQESYLNKIKCIYIDPPYNTGNDFIYNDSFSKLSNDELIESGQIDENGNKLVANNNSNGRFHSDWLSMMYPRLKLARNLLKNDGVIFISIDDNEVANLKEICDEIYGKNNFIAQCVRKRRDSQANLSKNISPIHEYILIYSKNNSDHILKKIIANINEKEYKNPDNDPRGPYKTMPCTNKGGSVYSVITPTGLKITEEWRFKKETYDKLLNENRLVFPRGGDGKPRYKLFLKEKMEEGQLANTWWDNLSSNQIATKELKELFDENIVFDAPKPIDLIDYCIQLCCNDDDVILDFFSGSATTAHSVLNYNAKHDLNIHFILIQLPEIIKDNNPLANCGCNTICDIGEERIRRAAKKIKDETNANIDYGFRVYRVDSSNMKDVFYKPNDLEQSQLRLLESNIKEDRTTDDLLTQVILDLGLTLDLDIEERMIGNNKVYYVAGNSLVACFDDNIDINIVDKICECEPYKVVFKDSAFKYDNDKINLEEKFKKLLPQRASDEGFINIL